MPRSISSRHVAAEQRTMPSNEIIFNKAFLVVILSIIIATINNYTFMLMDQTGPNTVSYSFFLLSFHLASLPMLCIIYFLCWHYTAIKTDNFQCAMPLKCLVMLHVYLPPAP